MWEEWLGIWEQQAGRDKDWVGAAKDKNEREG